MGPCVKEDVPAIIVSCSVQRIRWKFNSSADFSCVDLESVPKGQFVLRSALLRFELRQPASTNLWDSPASASLSERKSLDLD